MSRTPRILHSLPLLCAAVGLSWLGCSPDNPEGGAETPVGAEVEPDVRPGAGAQESSPVPPKPIKVGEYVAIDIRSPAFEPPDPDPGMHLAWERELSFEGATYIAPHFSHFNLPEGAHLIVRTPDDTRSRKYTGSGKLLPPGMTGFWGMHMPGDRAILQLYSRTPLAGGAVVLDTFARGLPKYDEMRDPSGEKALCGADDSLEAKCYETAESTVYGRGKAVARLLISGASFCTGWLVGSEGDVMTNQHCIGSAGAAANTDFEFMAEGADCDEDCSSGSACPGIVEADSSTVVRINAALDYALVKLPTNITGTYGFLQMREEGGEVGERIYIPQHPGGWGKRIAMLDGAVDATITSLTEPACTGGAPVPDVGYFADTQGGSSGSPVLGYNDHFVVALHHCANCPNRGVPIDAVVADLADDLPNDGIGVLCSPQPTVDAGPDVTVCLGDSVQIGTPALAGYTYQWGGGQTTAQISVSPAATTTFNVTATNPCSSRQDSVTVTVQTAPTGQCAPDQGDGSACFGDSACASGFCVDGVCCAQACGGACEACSIAAGSGADGSCQTLASGTVCRGASGGCDVIETCNGVSNACPADAIEAAGSTCRSSAGGCDPAETCDGLTAACPIDSLQPATFVCRGSLGGCDPAEFCTGFAAECPQDIMLSAGEPCRQRVDQCDLTEVCDGMNVACPADARAPAGQLCRSAIGGCDTPEFCDGVNLACPTNEVLAEGEVCRDSVGSCDRQEVCDGVNNLCPPNDVLEAGVVCRAAVGGCDAEEACDGTSGLCPDDALREAGEVCRDVAGNCDFVETCDGASVDCPADEVVAAGATCREAAGDCDVTEACDGANGACPTDEFVAAGEVCRNGSGSCDPDEACTGAAAACPDDAELADGTTCQVGECVNTGTCTSGVCQLEGGQCELPAEPGGCGCTSTDPATGLGTALMLMMAMLLATRRRRESLLGQVTPR